jgi:hypothetical protein
MLQSDTPKRLFYFSSEIAWSEVGPVTTQHAMKACRGSASTFTADDGTDSELSVHISGALLPKKAPGRPTL